MIIPFGLKLRRAYWKVTSKWRANVCYNLSVITMVVIAPALMMFLTSSIIVIPMVGVRRTTVLTVRIAIHWNTVTIDIWRPASFPLFLLSNLLGATNFLSISSFHLRGLPVLQRLTFLLLPSVTNTLSTIKLSKEYERLQWALSGQRHFNTRL